MLVGGRIGMPPGVTRLSETRIKEVLKIAAAEHFRLSAIVDPNTFTANVNCKNASGLELSVNFTAQTYHDQFKDVMRNAVNIRFDLKTTNMPLWHADILGPEAMRNDGYILPLTNEEAIERNVPLNPEFYVFLAFNHCLGDGLSMLAFVRTYFTKLNTEAFNREVMDLKQVPICREPPPLLDNLIKTSFLGIIPPAIAFIKNLLVNRNRLQRFKNNFEGRNNTSVEFPATPILPCPNLITAHTTIKIDDEPLLGGCPSLINLTNEGDKTSHRILFFSGDFSEKLRKECKANGTTIASSLVVIALGAFRDTFKESLSNKNNHMPSSQGFLFF